MSMRRSINKFVFDLNYIFPIFHISNKINSIGIAMLKIHILERKLNNLGDESESLKRLRISIIYLFIGPTIRWGLVKVRLHKCETQLGT